MRYSMHGKMHAMAKGLLASRSNNSKGDQKGSGIASWGVLCGSTLGRPELAASFDRAARHAELHIPSLQDGGGTWYASLTYDSRIGRVSLVARLD